MSRTKRERREREMREQAERDRDESATDEGQQGRDYVGGNGQKLTSYPERLARIGKMSRRQQKRLGLALSKQFQPHFWQDADSRIAVVRTIRKRVELMKAHTGADSYQKEILAQRAVFVAILLETAETKAAEGEPFDLAAYVQGVNCLTGLLRALGLEKRVKNVTDLKTYLDEKKGNGKA